MRNRTFREDLYFRLNVITVEMPPLRARPDDLLGFANYYAEHFANQVGRRFTRLSDEARDRILGHSWPGNLRELRNAIERAIILSNNDTLDAEDLPPDLHSLSETGGGTGLNGEAPVESNGTGLGSREASSLLSTPNMTLQQLEEAYIRRTLDRAHSLAEAAVILGIDQATLYRKRKKMNLE